MLILIYIEQGNLPVEWLNPVLQYQPNQDSSLATLRMFLYILLCISYQLAPIKHETIINTFIHKYHKKPYDYNLKQNNYSLNFSII